MSKKNRRNNKPIPVTQAMGAPIAKIRQVVSPVSLHNDLRAKVTEFIAVQRKAMIARRGSYRAAANPRSRNQTPYGGSGDQQVDSFSRRLARELARDLDRNADTFGVLMNAWCAAVHGGGVRWRPTTSDADWNHKASTALHRRMQEVRGGVDVRELRSGYQLLGDYVRATGVDGESALLKLDNGQAQGVESEQITNGGRYTSETVDGVQYDPAGRVVGFHILPYSGTGALAIGKGQDYSSNEVIWTPIRSRFSQTRGMPLLVAALDNWERLDSYIESEVIAAEQGSQLYGVIERIAGDNGMGGAFSPVDASADPSNMVRGGTNSNGGLDWGGTTAGALMELPNGAKYVPVNPQRPNMSAAPFVIEMLRMASANVGLPYEWVYNDLRGLSWSINRALVAMARDRIAITQSNTFGPAFNDFYRWQLAFLIEGGEIPQHPEWDIGELSWPQISWPDEGKEYEAQSLGLEKGLTTRHRVHGPSWRSLMAERLEELTFAAELADQHNKKFPQFSVAPSFFLGYDINAEKPSAKIDGGDELKPQGGSMTAGRMHAVSDDMTNKELIAAMATMRTGPQVMVAQEIRREDVASLGAAIAASLQPAPAPIVNVQVPEQPAPVINVAPATVQVAAPVVHVDAAEVVVPAPVVNVAPAHVDVHVPEHRRSPSRAIPQKGGSVLIVPDQG